MRVTAGRLARLHNEFLHEDAGVVEQYLALQTRIGIGRPCGFMVAEGSYLVGSAMQLGGLANYLRDRIPKRGP